MSLHKFVQKLFSGHVVTAPLATNGRINSKRFYLPDLEDVPWDTRDSSHWETDGRTSKASPLTERFLVRKLVLSYDSLRIYFCTRFLGIIVCVCVREWLCVSMRACARVCVCVYSLYFFYYLLWNLVLIYEVE